MMFLILLLSGFANAASQRKVDAGFVEFKHQASPSNSAANYGRFFGKSDGKLYYRSSAGTEFKLFDLDSILPVANGGTNSSAALSNNRVIRSSGDAIVEAAAITANRALISDANGIPTHSGATATELAFVSGVTSNIQTQLNGKQATGNYITDLTGDVTATGPGSVGATIAADAVSNSKLANMATQTIKGRTTAGAGDPEDLTATQATAVLNNFVGDSGAGGTKGLVPAPAAGDAAASKFLKANGDWAVPAGGGGSTVFARVSGNAGATATNTPIIFPTENSDVDNIYSTGTGRFTVSAGKTLCLMRWFTVGDNTNRRLSLYKNAGKVHDGSDNDTTGSGVQNGTGMVEVTAGDLLDVRPSNTMAGNANANASLVCW